jgi:hypothetical protein
MTEKEKAGCLRLVPYLATAWVGSQRGYWRARASNALGMGEWSKTFEFSFSE